MTTLTSDLLKTDTSPYDIESRAVSIFDFIKNTERFLDENYRGCYKESRMITPDKGVIIIRAEGYAEALKLIFNSISASHLITLTPTLDENLLHFNIRLDTSLLDKETKVALFKLSDNSGFTIKITDNNIEMTFALLDANYSAFQAVSSTFIYNILKKTFTA